LVFGAGAGMAMGQLFDFVLAGVGMDEVGSGSGVLQAVQQLASAVGVAALGTIFFSAFAGNPPTHALAITAWACLAPVAIAFALIFRLPCTPARHKPDRLREAVSSARRHERRTNRAVDSLHHCG
jgi:hypothetical protein